MSDTHFTSFRKTNISDKFCFVNSHCLVQLLRVFFNLALSQGQPGTPPRHQAATQRSRRVTKWVILRGILASSARLGFVSQPTVVLD